MAKNTVAVLDIRSAEVTAAVAERGVNGTFIVKSKATCAYEGYLEGNFIDLESFCHAVKEVVSEAVGLVGERIKKFYVGVPGEFVQTVVTYKAVSLSSVKKVSKKDTQILTEVSRPSITEGNEIIFNSCLYYVLSDKRKIIDPIGSVSESLAGKECFYVCKTSLLTDIRKAFEPFADIVSLTFLPLTHAEAMYLLKPELRDEYAVLVHLGFISSDYSVVCGNGIAYSDSFSVGIGHVAVLLMSELDVPYDVALKLLGMVNLNSKEDAHSSIEVAMDGKTYRFESSYLCEKIKNGLDGICEMLEACRQSYTEKNLDGKTLYITGEAVKTVRGTVEHLSNRLEKNVEVIAPPLPYYDKPQFSSLYSLLDLALTQNVQSNSFLSKLGF